MSWNCCRTCLSSQTLNTIFCITEQSEKYTNAIFMATGIKVEQSDALPQEMCTSCINFINESIKFRKKCEQTQKTLLDRLNNRQIYDIKVESIFKLEPEKAVQINITEDTDDDFKDYDDNVTLDTFQYNNYEDAAEKPVEKTEQIEFETRVQDIVEKPIEFIFNSHSVKKPKKRQVQKKKETDEKEKKKKPERVKEEIECEYCHKILTSRLSLRNHYKIHTGFDVVCEHCGKKFITRRLLLMHCRAKHGYEKTDKCSYCEYRASNAEQVKIHERLHTGEKPYTCKECGASFHRQSSYMQHVATHLPEKTVQCDQCPARFKSVTLMKIHKGRHRPSPYTFKCGVCDNSFARRRNVARHLLKVHGLQPEEVHIVRLHVGQV